MALLNATATGNLEMASTHRGRDDRYHRLVDERRADARYARRRVHVTIRETPEEACT